MHGRLDPSHSTPSSASTFVQLVQELVKMALSLLAALAAGFQALPSSPPSAHSLFQAAMDWEELANSPDRLQPVDQALLRR